jgi:hypothetical protein
MRVRIVEALHQRPSGLFELRIFRADKLLEEFAEENLVVDNYKVTHARLLGGDVANRSINTFGVGTNGTAPAGGNTALTGAFTKAVDSVTYPATNQVRFAFSLSTAQANGMAIMEFGLLTAGGLLYARKTRAAALQKENDISFNGTWTITF